MAVERRWPEGVYVRELPSVGGRVYSQVVASSGERRIDVAGTLPFDEDQRLVGEGDMRVQTRTVLQHIGRSLAEFGAGPQDVVRTKSYVVDMEAYLAEGVAEWVEFFGGNPPASTTVEVTALADSRALVEIEAYAVVD
jgi:enamine deaminase RidA (YjgF/YER057c/UK114 family)